jgi:gamma-glutamylcyclotransferase (GGCT)/AIG2-like uncharacterized protein YtfP
MKNFFAYGTLMCEDIMEEVSGCRLSGVPGVAKGYHRRPVKGEHYPALVIDDEGCVEGVVYQNVTKSAWDRLDRFEGEMYVRQPVQIELNNGSILVADTYLIRQAFLDHLEESEWNFAKFLRHDKECFQRDYRGYEQL